eukprot:10101662-Ditylum_brightwellii.AAC.1
MEAESSNIFQLLHRLGRIQKKKTNNHDEEDATVTEILLLLEKKPEVARGQDNCGRTPLHDACSNKTSLDVVSALLNAWPDAVKQTDDYYDGCTPLHEA